MFGLSLLQLTQRVPVLRYREVLSCRSTLLTVEYPGRESAIGCNDPFLGARSFPSPRYVCTYTTMHAGTHSFYYRGDVWTSLLADRRA